MNAIPILLALILTAASCLNVRELESVHMANGVKIGEVSPTSAIIWVRLTKGPDRNITGKAFPKKAASKAKSPPYDTLEEMEGSVPGAMGQVRITCWQDNDMTQRKVTEWLPVMADRDFTRQIKIMDLQPGTPYSFHVEGAPPGSLNPVTTVKGAFRTAPKADTAAPVQFAVVTGQEYRRRDDPEKGHKIYPEMTRLNPDFFVHTGDIEYYDKPGPYADSVALARFKWNRLYALPNQRDFHNRTASYFMKDDHDTLKDDCWPGQHYGDLTWDQGIDLFREQVPMGAKTYRTMRWGKDLQIWLVEGRDFRSPNNMPDGPEKTIWGKEQKQWFFDTVQESDAAFRILISPTPLVGPDRSNKNDNHANLGFKHEGDALREFIGKQQNMFVVCGDRHWQYVSLDPATGVREYSCGPTTDAHAGGFSEKNRSPMHQYLKIKGGFLSVAVYRSGGIPHIAFRHHGVDGSLYNEEILHRDPDTGTLSVESLTFFEIPNLVPEAPRKSPNYWCTWYAQNYWIGRGEKITDLKRLSNANAREELNEQTVFGSREGWAMNLLPRSRSDYYFLIDHGWQVKDEGKRLQGLPFFSFQVDTEDFPRYAGLAPEEALRKFNEEIKTLGWRGLGLWVRGSIDQENAERFVQWSKHAGIEYWKIDGGDTKDFYCFQAKEKLYPELVLEYVTPTGPLNPGWDQSDRDEYPSIYSKDPPLNLLQHSDTFRTYDATPLLVTATTLRRVHDILEHTQNQPRYGAILNLQDDVNAAAALGCLAAVKRHPNYGERTYMGQDIHFQIRGKRMIQHRMDEADRFALWQRIAPAFPAGEGTYLASDIELIDSYPYLEGDTWFKATHGKRVHQSAPAIMVRNMPLPEVEIDGEPPFVLAGKFPNGAVCIATEGRVKPENQWFHPRARVTIQVFDLTKPIGVFGHYEALIIQSEDDLSGLKIIWAQDLLAHGATNIMNRVTIRDKAIIIPGALIDEIGTSAGTRGDLSAPGLVIKLER